ncbi:LAMI_0E05666g1_1 [Lachancea mirantina]|uniref:LAMI_0E05666g1_1 n=1 Tax=Lachancea mirantina TaxID=1230905 RepID=A0A1G4JLJ8_9SACH|nr:LAMI_0E05666g1_1 [Lachancea mirantina]
MSTAKNFIELCYWCRVGDTENVDRLVSTGVDLNGVDEFDNTPLFLASLCGHEDLVNLLLQRGAVCDRDRYEGARCVYGALTDTIRNILLRYDISKAVDVKQPFATHISLQLQDSTNTPFDIFFSFNGQPLLKAHRFLLASRSAYFANKLNGPWAGKQIIHMPHERFKAAFEIILKYIYLIPTLHDIYPEDYKILKAICLKLQLADFYDSLNELCKTRDSSERAHLMAESQFLFTEHARIQMKNFVKAIVSQKREYKEAPNGIKSVEGDITCCSSFPDVLISLSDEANQKTLIYPSHRSILMRADYFRIMFHSNFSESTHYSQHRNLYAGDNVELPVLKFPSKNDDVACVILNYLYYDETEVPSRVAMDVLTAADALCLDRLKTMAAVSITQSSSLLRLTTPFDILSAGWDTRSERLEHYAAKVIARDLVHYGKHPKLKEAILESSARIKSRQETDTIELVDDIRYYLLRKYEIDIDDVHDLEAEGFSETLMRPELVRYSSDIQLLDSILKELNLEA